MQEEELMMTMPSKKFSFSLAGSCLCRVARSNSCFRPYVIRLMTRFTYLTKLCRMRHIPSGLWSFRSFVVRFAVRVDDVCILRFCFLLLFFVLCGIAMTHILPPRPSYFLPYTKQPDLLITSSLFR